MLECTRCSRLTQSWIWRENVDQRSKSKGADLRRTLNVNLDPSPCLFALPQMMAQALIGAAPLMRRCSTYTECAPKCALRCAAHTQNRWESTAGLWALCAVGVRVRRFESTAHHRRSALRAGVDGLTVGGGRGWLPSRGHGLRSSRSRTTGRGCPGRGFGCSALRNTGGVPGSPRRSSGGSRWSSG